MENCKNLKDELDALLKHAKNLEEIIDITGDKAEKRRFQQQLRSTYLQISKTQKLYKACLAQNK